MNLGDIIVTFRKKRKMRQGDLAAKANITQPYLSMIEGNKTEASVQTLTAIANVLGIPVQLLVVYSLTSKQIPEGKKEAYYKLMPLIHEIMEEYFLPEDTKV